MTKLILQGALLFAGLILMNSTHGNYRMNMNMMDPLDLQQEREIEEVTTNTNQTIRQNETLLDQLREVSTHPKVTQVQNTHDRALEEEHIKRLSKQRQEFAEQFAEQKQKFAKQRQEFAEQRQKFAENVQVITQERDHAINRELMETNVAVEVRHQLAEAQMEVAYHDQLHRQLFKSKKSNARLMQRVTNTHSECQKFEEAFFQYQRICSHSEQQCHQELQKERSECQMFEEESLKYKQDLRNRSEQQHRQELQEEGPQYQRVYQQLQEENSKCQMFEEKVCRFTQFIKRSHKVQQSQELKEEVSHHQQELKTKNQQYNQLRVQATQCWRMVDTLHELGTQQVQLDAQIRDQLRSRVPVVEPLLRDRPHIEMLCQQRTRELQRLTNTINQQREAQKRYTAVPKIRIRHFGMQTQPLI